MKTLIGLTMAAAIALVAPGFAQERPREEAQEHGQYIPPHGPASRNPEQRTAPEREERVAPHVERDGRWIGHDFDRIETIAVSI